MQKKNGKKIIEKLSLNIHSYNVPTIKVHKAGRKIQYPYFVVCAIKQLVKVDNKSQEWNKYGKRS